MLKSSRLIVLLALAMALSGCVNLNDKILRTQTLPQPQAADQAGWSQRAGIFPALINDTNLTTRTVTIATDNGCSSNVVTLKYEDIGANKLFDSDVGVGKLLNLGSSLLHSNTVVTTRVYKSDLNNILNLARQFFLMQGTNLDLVAALNSHIKHLLADSLISYPANNSNNAPILVSFDGIMATYMKAYLSGTFVDRWGNSISAPDLTQSGNELVTPLTRVFSEAVFDYLLMTPVVHDPSAPSTNKTPTFASIFPQLCEEISTNSDKPGITQAESDLINDVSQTGGQLNNLLSSLLTRAVGGASVGVKVSTGDNNTFSLMVSTLCSELASRTTEQVNYDFLERFTYVATTNAATQTTHLTPDYDQNDRALFTIPHPLQDGVTLLLENQDNLNNLLKNGWKFSGTNLTDYAAIAQTVLASSTGNTNVTVNASQLQAVQAIFQNAGAVTPAQQQTLVDSLQQLIQALPDKSGVPAKN